MRKIGSITLIWNHELFLGPHFDMLSKLDKNIVGLADGPLLEYQAVHGTSSTADRSEKIIRKKFPHVEIHDFTFQTKFNSAIYQPFMSFVQDCDIVLRLDPDMIFEPKQWDNFLNFIRSTDYDAYRMNYATCSVNYYMTYDFDHGLMDAKEYDILGFNPKESLTGILDYPLPNQCLLQDPEKFFFHHFRGWNKPKSTPKNWLKKHGGIEKLLKEHGNHGDWFKCPASIKKTMQDWLTELETF